jgi:hypothetical protein
MAKRVFKQSNMSWTAIAGGGTFSTPATPQWMAVKGGSATQIIDVLEVLISGMASQSTLGGFLLARATTLETAAGGSALAYPATDGGENPNITALVSGSTVIVFTAASTTSPTVNGVSTNAELNLSLNLFGGIIRWNAAPTQQWWIIGNATTTGESVLYNSTSAAGATGLANAHIIYEPY